MSTRSGQRRIKVGTTCKPGPFRVLCDNEKRCVREAEDCTLDQSELKQKYPGQAAWSQPVILVRDAPTGQMARKMREIKETASKTLTKAKKEVGRRLEDAGMTLQDLVAPKTDAELTAELATLTGPEIEALIKEIQVDKPMFTGQEELGTVKAIRPKKRTEAKQRMQAKQRTEAKQRMQAKQRTEAKQRRKEIIPPPPPPRRSRSRPSRETLVMKFKPSRPSKEQMLLDIMELPTEPRATRPKTDLADIMELPTEPPATQPKTDLANLLRSRMVERRETLLKNAPLVEEEEDIEEFLEIPIAKQKARKPQTTGSLEGIMETLGGREIPPELLAIMLREEAEKSDSSDDEEWESYLMTQLQKWLR